MTTRIASKGMVRGIAVAVAMLTPALFATQAQAQATIGLRELARFDLSLTSNGSNAEFIGSNPIAVGWNGTKLYVAGQNASVSTATVGIIEITNAASVTNFSASGFVTPTFSSTFGTLSTPAGNGYRGLAMNGNRLLASYDPGTNSVNGVQMFDASTNTRSWNLTASGTNTANIGTTRGYAGPDFDPGYLGNSGSGSGAAWVTQGQGRRFLNDSITGTSIYTTTSNVPAGALQGMIINSSSTTWRDIAFNPATGDLYSRQQDGILAALRTGSNSLKNPVTNSAGSSAMIWTQPTPGNNIASNLAYLNDIKASDFGLSSPYVGDLLIFNDRSSTSAGQSWTDVIKFMTTSGTIVTPTWYFLSTPNTGNAAYDFEWDQTTQTLAVVDYANRTVGIYQLPEPSTWAMLMTGAGACGGMALRRRMRRRG